MKYEYMSIIDGIFNFTIPGSGKTVKLFKGSKVVVDTKLAGSYLRVLKLVQEINDPVEVEQITKIEDKIVAVEETIENDEVAVVVADSKPVVDEAPAVENKRKRK